MGCLESKPTKDFYEAIEHDITMKDMVVFKNGSITERYEVDPTPIGNGTTGEVLKAKHKFTGNLRAVKVLSKKKIDEEKLRKEITLLRTLDHPNLLKIFEVYIDVNNFYVVSELCTGKDLFEYMQQQGKISEAIAARIIREVLSGIGYMHRHGVGHLNINPTSLRFDNDKENAPIKITNFANAEVFKDYSPYKKLLNTPEYMAPEVILGAYTTRVDVWACGILLYILLSGKVPFNGATRDEMLNAIKTAPVEFNDAIWSQISDEAKDLITKLLQKDMRDRISAEDALVHPWLHMKLDDKTIDKKAAQEALDRMKAFRATKSIQSAIWTYMTHYVAAKEEKETMLYIFKALDRDNDGQLSKEEVKEGYRNYFTIPTTYSVDGIFDSLDKNKSDHIDYHEFIEAALGQQMMASKTHLENTFKMLDADGSGGISVDELRSAFGSEAVLADDNYWANLIKQGDKNGDGQIQFEEFMALMKEMRV